MKRRQFSIAERGRPFPLPIAVLAAAVTGMVCAQACGSDVVADQPGSSAASVGGGGGLGGGGATSSSVEQSSVSSSTGGSTPTPTMCAGQACAKGEDCCLTSGECYDPAAAPDACPTPDLPPNKQGQKACASSAQCAESEFCNAANPSLCLGPGYCEDKANCGTSSGVEVCGCNGVTYPDVQTACAAGVHVIGQAPCGKEVLVGGDGGDYPGKPVTYCATSDVCPDGQACCSITGMCYDTSKPALCAFPPDGASLPCLEDSDCLDPQSEYCNGPGCDGPGGCVALPGTGTCSGELAPVCGCDGTTYVNAQCAAAAGTRIDHDGDCQP